MTTIGLHSVDVKTLVVYFVSNVSLRNIWMIILTPSDLEGLWSLNHGPRSMIKRMCGMYQPCGKSLGISSVILFFFSNKQLHDGQQPFYSHKLCSTAITIIWSLVHFLYISFVSAVHTLMNYPTMLPQNHCINLYWSIDFFTAFITVSSIYLLFFRYYSVLFPVTITC